MLFNLNKLGTVCLNYWHWWFRTWFHFFFVQPEAELFSAHVIFSKERTVTPERESNIARTFKWLLLFPHKADSTFFFNIVFLLRRFHSRDRKKVIPWDQTPQRKYISSPSKLPLSSRSRWFEILRVLKLDVFFLNIKYIFFSRENSFPLSEADR